MRPVAANLCRVRAEVPRRPPAAVAGLHPAAQLGLPTGEALRVVAPQHLRRLAGPVGEMRALSQVDTAACRRSSGVSASGEAYTSGVNAAARACRQIRLIVRTGSSGLVAFPDEQPPAGPEAEPGDVPANDPGQHRRARRPAYLPDCPLFELPPVAVVPRVGPPPPGVRLGRLQDELAPPVVAVRQPQIAGHLDADAFLRPQPGVVEAGVSRRPSAADPPLPLHCGEQGP
jgi:hypothetical protein